MSQNPNFVNFSSQLAATQPPNQMFTIHNQLQQQSVQSQFPQQFPQQQFAMNSGDFQQIQYYKQIQQQQEQLIKNQEEERRKYEKTRQYQMQQKRLQELSVSGANKSSLADHLMKDILQNVDNVKSRKSSTNVAPAFYHTPSTTVFSTSLPQQQMQTPNMSLISTTIPLPVQANTFLASFAQSYPCVTSFANSLASTSSPHRLINYSPAMLSQASSVSQMFGGSISSNIPIQAPTSLSVTSLESLQTNIPISSRESFHFNNPVGFSPVSINNPAQDISSTIPNGKYFCLKVYFIK